MKLQMTVRGQVPPKQPHFVRGKLQVDRVCIFEWEEHTRRRRTNQCEAETNFNILHLHEPRHVHDSYQDVLGLSESCKESIIAQPGMEEPVGDDGVGRH